MQKQQENIVLEKSNEACPLSIRVQTTKPHFVLFLPGKNVKENVFFFRARVQKGIAWHIDASSVVWTLIIQQIETLSKYGHDYQQWQIVVKL